jgi:parallel beta-helix repeat protein
MFRKIALVVLFYLFGASAVHAGNIIVIKADGSGDYPTIQAAVNAATNGDTIVLEPGIYQGVGNRDVNYDNRAITITSIDPNDAAVVAATVVDCQGSATEYHRGFSFHNNVLGQSLRGLTIRNAYTNGSGAALLCDGGSRPIIEKNVITDNFAEQWGGGIFIWEAEPEILANTFTRNEADGGGGIYVKGPTCLILDNRIEDNTASVDKGGGIYVNSCEAFIRRNTLRNNEAINGGGIFCLNQPSAIIENNRIRANHVTGSGGAIYMEGTSPDIANNFISENSAGNYGAGLSYNNSFGTIINNTIAWNASLGAGIHCGFGSTPDIINNIVAFNDAGINKGFGDPAPLLKNNCVFGNSAYNYGGNLAPGTGDISQDPKLANWDAGYLHIQPDSPCIDQGDSSAVLPEWHDIDDQARIQAADVDIGADESDGARWPRKFTVKADGSGDVPKIQDAIDLSNNGDMIVLEPGYYCNDRNWDLDYLGKAITVCSTDPDDPDIVRDTVIFCTGQFNHRGFKFHSGETPDSVLRGITIKGSMPPFGDFVVNGVSDRHGGGIICYGASPTIAQCVIETCEMSYYGGGICLSRPDGGTQGANPVISDCIIRNNGNAWAPGLYCYASYPTISNCQIRDNTSGMHHIGGIGFLDCNQQTITLTGCDIIGNYAVNGDGGMGIDNSHVILNDCLISQNSAGHGAGGLRAANGAQVLLQNCLITANLMRNNNHGSAIAGFSSQVTIRNCTIEGNWCPWTDSVAVWMENSYPAATVINSIVWNNEPQANQVQIHQGYGSVTYCDVQDDTTGTGNFNQDPLFARNGQWQDPNTPGDRNDDLWIPGDYHLQSKVGRWDPLANAGIGAWVIDAVLSPAIDAGDPATDVGDEPEPNANRANVGVYGTTPFASKSWLAWKKADINDDGKVDMNDLAIFSQYWLHGVE